MKKNATLIFTLLLALISITGCKELDDTNESVSLPPYESMVIDFGDLTNTTKSGTINNTEATYVNWTYSAVSVGFWNVIIGTTFAVPVAAFKTAFSKSPQKIDDNQWQWSYTVDGFTSQYTARLVGTLETSQIQWQMYVTKTGINAFDEFLWFEGTSNLDGESGQWILYHSPTVPEEVIQIDWEKTGDEVGSVQYTYVRELNDEGQENLFNGSTLTYGLQDASFDAYVNIHVYSAAAADFVDSQIEWSRSDYSGHVMSENFFGDADWHCWDSTGADSICE